MHLEFREAIGSRHVMSYTGNNRLVVGSFWMRFLIPKKMLRSFKIYHGYGYGGSFGKVEFFYSKSKAIPLGTFDTVCERVVAQGFVKAS